VGLPARGKTYLARKIARYFNWLGVECEVFNVGAYRRKMFGAEQPSEFFDPENAQAELNRQQAAIACLQDMLNWISASDKHQIAVYDATNSTRKRRQMVCQACQEKGVSVMFIESICGDEEVIKENVRMVKANSPDYASKRGEENKAVADFMARIAHYARVYESVGEKDCPNENGTEYSSKYKESDYPIVKLIDLGRRYEIHGLERGGGLWRKARLTHLLINLQPRRKAIFLTRHGESDFNLAGRIGGDGDLSASGWKFAELLPGVLVELNSDPLEIWTSSFRRTKQTAQFFNSAVPRIEWKALDEIDAGVCEGLTYKEISIKYPKDFAARDLDKFKYRYYSIS
jgi:6-phosphofructo-2-kinase/fructose-2,6-biphosphatase 2